MRKKRIVVGTALALAAVAVAAAGLASVRRAPYPFLEGAERVLDRRVRRLGDAPWNRVYNIHRPIEEVQPRLDGELRAAGWKPMWARGQVHLYSRRSGARIPGATGFASDIITLLPGRAEVAEEGRIPYGLDPVRTAEGWTAVMISEHYNPTWLQSLFDRFMGPPPLSNEGCRINVLPSSEFHRATFGAPPKGGIE